MYRVIIVIITIIIFVVIVSIDIAYIECFLDMLG